MKKITTLLTIAGALSMLTSCKDETPAEEIVQTVDWYKTNNEARAAVIAKCQNNPGELATTPNCVNASMAESSSTWGATGGIKAPEPLKFERK